LLRDGKGNIYSMTYDGGTSNFGTVFKRDKAGKETVLHSFRKRGDGGCPYFGPLLRDAGGNLYGATSDGGDAGLGVIFKLNSDGKETLLHSFAGAPDGAYPMAGLVQDAAGNFYGTTLQGGSGACPYGGCGTVFKLDAAGRETVLYSFSGGADGRYPYANLVRDEAGDLYGTTTGGGGYACDRPWGCGTVFRLRKGKLTVLHTFAGGKDGAIPYAGVVRDRAGNLYGTTNQGGGYGLGTVFKLDKNGKETVLHRFSGLPDGALPGAGLILDAAGNLYGTTAAGGSGAGTVFKLDSKGNETVLYHFPRGVDGSIPQAGLIRDAAGNLYGTTTNGGAGHGVVFKLAPRRRDRRG
jgi:uncharacterized repeat protein (TIGR03803 family)